MSTDKVQHAELDHVFILTQRGGGALATHLERLGLKESYRRRHVGQGTANICYCFENAFLELLWIEDEAATQTDAIKRCQFVERLRDGNPFGIAWRGPIADIKAWDYKPPYLPDELCIQVAVDSDDIHQPFMFTFPGSKSPKERGAVLQEASGFARMEVDFVALPQRSDALLKLSDIGVIGAVRNADRNLVGIKLKSAPESALDDLEIVLPLAD